MVAVGRNCEAQPNRRDAPREEVYHRTRATRPGSPAVPLQIVNISASGFMARTEAALEPGATLSPHFPVIGERAAELRWALGGRIGCQFRRPIDFPDYLELLAALARNAD